MLTLLGVLVVILGFAFRLNPLLVVLAASVVTGVASGMDAVEIVSSIGKAFTGNRFLAVTWLVIPAVGVLEHVGLRERAEAVVKSLRGATMARVLVGYLALRQVSAALGMISLGGHAQMVRPLVAPLAEAAAGDTTEEERFTIRAYAAATDNVGVFFGEDIFIAMGSILLMKGFLADSGYEVEPLDLAIFAIPTALFAFVVQSARIVLLGRRLAKRMPR